MHAAGPSLEGQAVVCCCIPCMLVPAAAAIGLHNQVLPVCRAGEAEDIQWHLCSNGCSAFAPVKRAAWREHADDACGRCGGKRFKTAGQEDAGVGGARLRPVKVRTRAWLVHLWLVHLWLVHLWLVHLPCKHTSQDSVDVQQCAAGEGVHARAAGVQVMYYYGVAAMLRSLYMDPDFSAGRREGCQGGPSMLRGYQEYERLNGKVGSILDDTDNVMVELAADGFQPFSGSQHSSHLWAIRCGLGAA